MGSDSVIIACWKISAILTHAFREGSNEKCCPGLRFDNPSVSCADSSLCTREPWVLPHQCVGSLQAAGARGIPGVNGCLIGGKFHGILLGGQVGAVRRMEFPGILVANKHCLSRRLPVLRVRPLILPGEGDGFPVGHRLNGAQLIGAQNHRPCLPEPGQRLGVGMAVGIVLAQTDDPVVRHDLIQKAIAGGGIFYH